MNVFASSNPNKTVRASSSSGGVFSMLAEYVIANGGSVYGASFDDKWHVVHKRIDSVKDLNLLRGSKYVYSNVGQAYSDAMIDLSAGRKVLFSGTPCQIAAMLKRAGEHSSLILVETVCHGAPDPIYWEKYLSELCHKCHQKVSDITSITFRDKHTGWKNYSFTIQFNKNKCLSQLHNDNPYMRAFLNDYTLRDACFRCPFKYPEGSKADITLGDLWGINHLAPELDDDLGTSLIIIRTPVGHNIYSSLKLQSKAIDFDEVAKFNPALIQSAIKPYNLDKFREKTESTQSVTSAFKQYASVPLILKIKQKIYRLIHK